MKVIPKDFRVREGEKGDTQKVAHAGEACLQVEGAVSETLGGTR
jgi:hypothetical protein